jgi:hypothetical protein
MAIRVTIGSDGFSKLNSTQVRQLEQEVIMEDVKQAV